MKWVFRAVALFFLLPVGVVGGLYATAQFFEPASGDGQHVGLKVKR